MGVGKDQGHMVVVTLGFIGIDPGKTGAIAFLHPTEQKVFDMPYVGGEPDVGVIRNWLTDFKMGRTVTVVIESQQSMPGQGVSSTFTLGKGYGMVLATVMLAGVRVIVVRPTQWKKEMGIPPKSDKDYSRLLAMRTFPDLQKDLQRKKDDGRADALLIAGWGRKQP